MRVFVTGATGFVGSAVVRELLDAGHQVLGLARSDESEVALKAAGAEAHRGALDDLDSLRDGAARSDGVIHTAFVHDFSDYGGAVETDRRAVEALGEVLAGSDLPFVVTSGLPGRADGGVATEDDMSPPDAPRASETALSFADRGVRVSAVRLPPSVHGGGDHGFVPFLIDAARRSGVAVYPADGSGRWASVHRLDAARLFRLALESAPAGARLHGVGEEGVPVREIAEVIGRQLRVPVTAVSPEQVQEALGFVGTVFSTDIPASSARTRKVLDWRPTRPGLVADLEEGHYFAN